jgi:electron transfer flavoprotein alpha subunit
MLDILVFSEVEEIAFELLSWGRKIKESNNAKVSAVILGKNAKEKADLYFSYGTDKVIWSENPLLTDFSADVYTEALYQIINMSSPELLLIGSTRRGKELAARVAQKWSAACVTDAIALDMKDNELVVSRYTLGGATISVGVLKALRKIVSVMPKAFELGPRESILGKVVEASLKLQDSKLKVIERKAKQSERVNLEEAQALVCVGRGLSKKEDLASVEALAKALNAEIGCTRPLSHDWQWLSEQREVGLSGKKCKPHLCVSLGISGQIQHTVGIRGAKIIVAINTDKSAPIFEIADYGVVGDLYKVLPLLIEKIHDVNRTDKT